MRQKRDFAPRGKETINRQLEPDSQDGARTGTMPGDYSINPNIKEVRYERLRCYTGGKTTIRIWPMLDPTNPTEGLLNGRLNTQQTAGLGGMSISEPAVCVSFSGVKRDSKHLPPGEEANPFSYVIARSDQQRELVEGVSYWNEPYIKLYVTCKRAKDSGQFANGKSWDSSWNSLMAGQTPELCAFKKRYFVICSIYENSDSFTLERERVKYRKNNQDVEKVYPRNGIALGDAPTDPLVIMQLPISAGKKIFQLANIEKQDWQGDENIDPAIMFKYGDPTGRFDPATGTVKGGVFFTLYNPTKCVIEKNTTYKGFVPQIVEYEAAVASRFQAPGGAVVGADMSKEQVDNVLSKHVFFWKESESDGKDSYALHEPSIQQRCEIIARGFRFVPKLLEFSWMSHPEYLNFDSVSAILKNRRVIPVAKPVLEDTDEPEELPAVKPVAAQKSKPVAKQLVDDFDDDDLDDVVPAAKPTVAQKPKSAVKQLVDDFDDDELDEDELADDVAATGIVSKKVAAKGKVASKPIDDDEFDDEDEDDDAEVKADDFDDEQDPTKVNAALEDQLNASMSKANAIARSRSRSSKPGK